MNLNDIIYIVLFNEDMKKKISVYLIKRNFYLNQTNTPNIQIGFILLIHFC